MRMVEQVPYYSIDELQRLKGKLEAILRSPKEGHGLCYNMTLRKVNRRMRNLVEWMWARWPGFSGRYTFPVPVPAEFVNNYSGKVQAVSGHYFATEAAGTVWDMTTEYARSRRDMTLWLIESLGVMIDFMLEASISDDDEDDDE